MGPKGSSVMILESFGGLSMIAGWMKNPFPLACSGSPTANL